MLRTGISNFFQNAKSWELRTGTQLKEFYNKSREIAHRVRPHLEQTARIAENVNTQLQRDLSNLKHRETAGNWTNRLRKFTDTYNTALTKADQMHDIVMS